jgi:succinate dehydrogenase flavin-adding protein (antitoxin of CptAB toxin-antitoxin module)
MFSSVSRRIVHQAATTTKSQWNRPVLTTVGSTRQYRGESGEAEQRLSAEEEALIKIAKPRADEIFKKHIELPVDDLETRQKRLIYRSKQRGWLEVDLLLGTWASENVMKLNREDLDQFEDFVNMETIDIYNIITLRLDVPEELQFGGEGVVERIQEWARQHPLGKADPVKYKSVKAAAKLI